MLQSSQFTEFKHIHSLEKHIHNLGKLRYNIFAEQENSEN